jgi:hypothetical protein
MIVVNAPRSIFTSRRWRLTNSADTTLCFQDFIMLFWCQVVLPESTPNALCPVACFEHIRITLSCFTINGSSCPRMRRVTLLPIFFYLLRVCSCPYCTRRAPSFLIYVCHLQPTKSCGQRQLGQHPGR